MTLRNNIGCNANGSGDIATEITNKSRRFWPPRCRLKPPRHGTPTNISMSLTPLESGVPKLHFCADYIGLFLSNFSFWDKATYWLKIANFPIPPLI